MNREYNMINPGDVRLDNEVIKNIAVRAAIEIPGVHELKRGKLRDLWSYITGKTPAMGARLEFANDMDVRIKLKLLVEYGVQITDAAIAVQENVKKAVEYMTGLNVVNVTVSVVGIFVKK